MLVPYLSFLPPSLPPPLSLSLSLLHQIHQIPVPGNRNARTTRNDAESGRMKIGHFCRDVRGNFIPPRRSDRQGEMV